LQPVEKDFATYYMDQLHSNEMLPSFILDFFEVKACLSFSDTKCVYVVSEILSNKQYILKQVSITHLAQSKMEWELLYSLSHWAIPKAYKWHMDDRYTYMIREYFEGMTLEALVLGKGPVQRSDVLTVANQLCDLLEYLHSQSPPIIHRDIKPQNLIMRPDGKIGVIDFDISRRYDFEASKDTVYMGTLQTAAPEQFGYQQTSQQTDIYAFGILLIYLMTGSFDKSKTCELPLKLKKIADKCTEFSPKDRYRNVQEIKRQMTSKKITPFFKGYFAVVSVIIVAAITLFSTQAMFYKPKTAIPSNAYAKEEEFLKAIQIEQAIEEITFKNNRIEQAVRKELGKTNNEHLSKEELSQVYYLEIIGDLQEYIVYEDLQHNYAESILAYNGEYLRRGTVDSLEDLSLLPNLSELTLVYQQISDLWGIEKLHLQKLSVAYNHISDLTPLKDMESLTFLRINCNLFEDLTPLEDLSKLEYLQICGTNVKDISPLASLNSLKTLDLFGMKNIDLSPLGHFEDSVDIIQ